MECSILYANSNMIIYEAKITYTKVGTISHENLDQPDRVADYMHDAFDDRPMQEQFWTIMLNRKNYPIGRERTTIGSISACHVDISTAFRPAILAGASAVIFCHNHPSGDPSPSKADISVTHLLCKAGGILDICVHDKVIIGTSAYSFQQNGHL